MTTRTFKVGDRVKHTARFLQSIRWITDVPKYGIVRSLNEAGWPRVQWCDADEATLINPNNIMHAADLDYTGL